MVDRWVGGNGSAGRRVNFTGRHDGVCTVGGEGIIVCGRTKGAKLLSRVHSRNSRRARRCETLLCPVSATALVAPSSASRVGRG